MQARWSWDSEDGFGCHSDTAIRGGNHKEGGPSRALQIAGIKQFHLHAHKEQHLIRVPLDYFSRLKKALINKSQEVSFRALTFSPWINWRNDILRLLPLPLVCIPLACISDVTSRCARLCSEALERGSRNAYGRKKALATSLLVGERGGGRTDLEDVGMAAALERR